MKARVILLILIGLSQPGQAQNLAHGKKINATCHARDGMGRGKFPFLVGQYTSYLRKQMDTFIKGERTHDEVEMVGILNQHQEQDLNEASQP